MSDEPQNEVRVDIRNDTRGEGRSSVTMREVAERAGVSMMTVSRVMNATAIVRPSTREKVEAAIRDLNYRPNLGARRLAGGKSLFVGLLYHNPSPSYLSQVLVGSLAACRKDGHHLVLDDLGTVMPYVDPEAAVRSLNTSDLDGLVVTPPLSGHAPLMEALGEVGLPIVHIAPGDMPGATLQVAMNDMAAMKEMVMRVVGFGHKRVAFVAGPSEHPSSSERYRGFVEGLRAFKLASDDELLHRGDYTYRSGFDAGRRLFNLKEQPTAVVASNDDMAAGVVAAAYTFGLRVPEDVSVTGFDDTMMARNVWPELTTVRQPIAEMAEQAVRLLTAHLQGDAKAVAENSQELGYQIRMRDSLAKFATAR